MSVLHPDIHALLKDLSSCLNVTSRYLSKTSFLLNIPFCVESLTWQLTFARVGVRHACPDIIVPDTQFTPLIHSERVQAAYLGASDLQQRGLTRLVKELLDSYDEYQRHLLDQLASPGTALRFEADTVFGATDVRTQILCTPSQALFAVTPFSPVDWQQLHALLRQLGIEDGELHRMQPDLRLRVDFPLSPAHAQQSPALRLHIPPRLESLAGRVELPPWPAGRMCILEYVPLVKDAVQASIAQAVGVCTMRRDVFRELSSTGLGAPIELDTTFYSTATFDLPSDRMPLLLLCDLPPSFPQQKPWLTLQAGSNTPPKLIQDYIWDPKWTAADMAENIHRAIERAQLSLGFHHD